MSEAASTPPWETLEAAALAVQKNAHAPYSKYHVGAAIWTTTGKLFSGCNVENASYGLCCCAERSAIAAMVSAGHKDLAALAVVTTGDEPGSPCGMCRQVLSEFALRRPVPIRMLAERSGVIVKRLDTTVPELLPLAFLPSVLLGKLRASPVQRVGAPTNVHLRGRSAPCTPGLIFVRRRPRQEALERPEFSSTRPPAREELGCIAQPERTGGRVGGKAGLYRGKLIDTR